MATNEIKHYSPIAAAPSKDDSAKEQPKGMSYACKSCTKRKVKCSKEWPACSNCRRRSPIECEYQPPAPRKKRKLSVDVNERLRQYESILTAHGLLKDEETTDGANAKVNDTLSLRMNEDSRSSRPGLLLTNAKTGETRYLDSNLWRQIGSEDMHQMIEDDEEDHVIDQPAQYPSDPLSGALAGGGYQNLLPLHPPFDIAMELWSLYVTNCDPLCRILHCPSTEPVFRAAAMSPGGISKSTECLLFAVYHFAVTSMDEEACISMFSEPRKSVLARFRNATIQALVNANFLRTAEYSVLQNYVLFLLAARLHYDPNTFYVLTGVAWRLAQRQGIHKDGEYLKLNSKFDIHMRRRMFWQILPLDGIAAQLAGTGISPTPEAWNVKPLTPLNEDQLWPGQLEFPKPQTGASDMIFCLARAKIGEFHSTTKSVMLPREDEQGFGPGYGEAESAELERRIDECQDSLEREIVRYCDVVEPLHLLTISLCRGAMTVIRLRLKLNLARRRKMSESQMREVHKLAIRTVDYMLSAYETPALRRYLWHFKALFQHSSLACLLTTMKHVDLLTPSEIKSSWQKLEAVCSFYPEIFERRTLHVAIARLTMKAWAASGHLAGFATQQPAFIEKFRVLSESKKHDTAAVGQDQSTSPDSNILTGMSVDDFNADLSLDPNDWMYWDMLEYGRTLTG